MPLIFSYGSLQQEEVQRCTFGRLLDGRRDEFPGCVASRVKIDDPDVAAKVGSTHHNNVTFNGNPGSRIPGMVFEISEAELERVDAYEAAFSYRRIAATLASGRHAWVYVCTPCP